jgi:hypothetical protein
MITEKITGLYYNVADYDKPFWFEGNHFKYWQQIKIMFLKQQKELLIFEVEYCSCILYN